MVTAGPNTTWPTSMVILGLALTYSANFLAEDAKGLPFLGPYAPNCMCVIWSRLPSANAMVSRVVSPLVGCPRLLQ